MNYTLTTAERVALALIAKMVWKTFRAADGDDPEMNRYLKEVCDSLGIDKRNVL